jgi:hypothetical protein
LQKNSDSRRHARPVTRQQPHHSLHLGQSHPPTTRHLLLLLEPPLSVLCPSLLAIRPLLMKNIEHLLYRRLPLPLPFPQLRQQLAVLLLYIIYLFILIDYF